MLKKHYLLNMGADSRVKVMVVTTDEELVIASDTQDIVEKLTH